MAQGRRRTRQSHAQRVANYLAKHPGASQGAARGHGAHTRPAGVTEAQERRRRENTRILREGGLSASERARIVRWVERMARETSRAAETKGRAGVDPGEAHEAGLQLARQWDRAGQGWGDFERFRDSIEAADRGEAYHQISVRYGGTGSPDDVADDWIEEIDDEYGLSLSENILWFLLWRSGKPPKGGEREAA